MLTLQALNEYGADTAQGLNRCMGNEAFYLRLVGMLAKDGHTQELADALARRDLDAAFDAAHSLKGVLANLALTPALTPILEITEDLRARKDMDYQPLMDRIQTEMDRLMALLKA